MREGYDTDVRSFFNNFSEHAPDIHFVVHRLWLYTASNLNLCYEIPLTFTKDVYEHNCHFKKI